MKKFTVVKNTITVCCW